MFNDVSSAFIENTYKILKNANTQFDAIFNSINIHAKIHKYHVRKNLICKTIILKVFQTFFASRDSRFLKVPSVMVHSVFQA